jgi:hypothetical protein
MNIRTTAPDTRFCQASTSPIDCVITKLGGSSVQEIKKFFNAPENEELFIIGENLACYVPNEGIHRIYRRTPLPVIKPISEQVASTSIPQDQLDCFNKRYPVCTNCPEFNKDSRQCNKLGIQTTYHLYNSFKACPLKKWETS